jgi:SNF2 family DNA or RNA helicase
MRLRIPLSATSLVSSGPISRTKFTRQGLEELLALAGEYEGVCQSIPQKSGRPYQHRSGRGTRHAMVISSYSPLQRDADILQDLDWGMVVLDEAQNIKNPETKQARAARSLKAGFRIALTGTPVENNVGDLWSIMEFLNPGMLGTQTEFKRVFFAPIQVQRDQEASQRLKRLTGPFILRRLKTDKKVIGDLPEKMETLTKEQASLYAAVVAALAHEWSNGTTEGHINRLKTLKRAMYIRAKFDLLRIKVLAGSKRGAG